MPSGSYGIVVSATENAQCTNLSFEATLQLSNSSEAEENSSTPTTENGSNSNSSTPLRNKTLQVFQFQSLQLGCKKVLDKTYGELVVDTFPYLSQSDSVPLLGFYDKDSVLESELYLRLNPFNSNFRSISVLKDGSGWNSRFNALRASAKENAIHKIVFDDRCKTDETFMMADRMRLFATNRESVSSFREKLPIAFEVTSSGLSKPEIKVSYSYDERNGYSYKLNTQVNMSAFKTMLGDELSSITKIEWLINGTEDYGDFRINETQTIDLESFLDSGTLSLVAKGASTVGPLLFNQHKKYIGIIVTKNTSTGIGRDTEIKKFVIETGKLCTRFYNNTTPENLALYSSIFDDQTTPLSDGTYPNAEQRIGCAFVDGI